MLRIDYFTDGGRGSMIIDLDQFLPCTKKDFRILIDTIYLSVDPERIAKEVYDHIADRVAGLKKLRDKIAPVAHKADARKRKINNQIKKLLASSDELVKRFGFDPINETDDNSNNTTNEKENEVMKENNKNYFAGVKTLEELRTAYKDLLKINHPDNGGDVAIMQEINAQYDQVRETLKSGATIEDEKDAAKWSDVEDESIRQALYKVIHLHGINIEIVGCWIWIDGDTFANREALKEAGYKWSRTRQKWHFAPYESKWHKGSKKSFDQLRRTYGSAKVESEERHEIA